MSAYYTTADVAQLCAQEPVALGVIGNPIAHSKSPQMQQSALDADSRPYRYIRLLADTADGGFENLLRQLEELNFIGVNVTVPFKKKALAAAREADALSTLCGAANTLKRHPEGGWTAINTDGPGFAAAIQELSGKSLCELRVIILGACGGAGSALAAQCVLSECRALCLVNRPRPELQQMASDLASRYTGELSTCHFDSPELRAAVAQADLIVNATSLGLKEGDPLPLPPEWLNPGQMVYDIVTHDTPLRKAAAKRGCLTDNGLAMLLWQGAYAYNYWFGNMPDIDCMRTALQQA